MSDRAVPANTGYRTTCRENSRLCPICGPLRFLRYPSLPNTGTRTAPRNMASRPCPRPKRCAIPPLRRSPPRHLITRLGGNQNPSLGGALACAARSTPENRRSRFQGRPSHHGQNHPHRARRHPVESRRISRFRLLAGHHLPRHQPGHQRPDRRRPAAQIDAMLEHHGTDKTRLLTATIWVKNIADRGAMNEVWTPWLPKGWRSGAGLCAGRKWLRPRCWSGNHGHRCTACK